MRDAADGRVVAARYRTENHDNVFAFVRQKTWNQIAQILVYFHSYPVRHVSSLGAMTSARSSASLNRCPSIASRIASNSVDFLIGLVTCASQPAALLRCAASSSADAVNATMGVRSRSLARSQPRIALVAW